LARVGPFPDVFLFFHFGVMSPFTDPHANSKPAKPGGFWTRAPFIAFTVCAVLGLVMVVWRAGARSSQRRALAQAETLARASALERQLEAAVSAAEALGAVARQNGGPIPNFQIVAAGLLAARPLLASLESQPGGVISEIVPRAGNERFLGLNVLKDPAQRPGANLSAQSRLLTVSGPVPLARNQPGLVARAPVYQRGRDGRDYFWGFVAASIRIPDAMNAAGVDELWNRGYSYALSAPAPAPHKAATLVRRGDIIEDGAAAPVRVRNVEFRLEAKPLNGWGSWGKTAFELLGVLAFAGLAALLVSTVQDRRGVEATLEEVNQQLSREIADRKRAQEELQTAKDGLTTAQTESKQASQALHQAEALMAELQHLVETTARESSETADSHRAKLQEAERRVGELSTRLEEAARQANEADRTHRAELEQAQSLLAQARRTSQEMQTRLDAALAAQREAASDAKAQAQRDQTAIAELRLRLETTLRSTQEAGAASDALLAELETTNNDLKSRLADAEKWEHRAAELTELLERTEAELRRQQASATVAAPALAPAPIPAPEPEMVVSYADDTPATITSAPSEAPRQEEVKPDAEPSPEVSSGPVEPEATVATPVEATPSAKTDEEPMVVFDDDAVLAAASAPEPEPTPAAPVAPETPEPVNPIVSDSGTPPVTPESGEESAAPSALETEAPATPPKSAKAPRRRKARPVNQMDLFRAPPPAEPVADSPAGPPPAAVEQTVEQPTEAVEEASPSSPAAEEPVVIYQDASPEALVEPEPVETPAAESPPSEEAPATPPPSDSVEERGAREEHPETPPAPSSAAREEKRAPARRLPAPPPFDPSQFRKASSLMVPLLSDGDPGAKDCLKDNRNTFRSVFSPEGYIEFEHAVKGAHFETALDHLRKAARKHGISA
jgi:hypothetical protein